MKEDLIEKLIETGEAKEKLNHKDTDLSVLALLGYKVGHQWASRQKEGDLLSRFEEFYTDLINNRLTKQRYNMLYEELNPASIIAEIPDTINQSIDDPKVAEAMMGNYHIFENGIVWGLMSVIRRIIMEDEST